MKRARLFVMLAVFTVLGGALYAAPPKDYIPDLAHFDGSSWNRIERIDHEWSDTFKSFLVRGVYEGMYTGNPQMFAQHFNNDISTRDIVDKLDAYYKDEKNAKTPVSYAITLVIDPPKSSEPVQPAVQGNTLISKGTNS